MKKSKFTEEQIAFALRQAHGHFDQRMCFHIISYHL